MASESEVGLRLSLKNRRETSRGLKDTAKDVEGVGDAAEKASKKSDGLGRSFSGLRRGMGTLAKGAGIVGGAIATAVGLVGAFGVKAAASLETATMNLTTLTGSARKAKVMVRELTKYGNATTFDTDNLTAAAQQMLTFGIATKDVMPYMRMLGDISMGNSQKLSGLAYVFAQVQGAGKLMGGDLMQMINQGFNPLIYISKRTGKSIGELRSEMSKGQISFDMVKRAMQDATKKGGQFYQGAKNGSKTLAGAWGNLTGTIQSTLGSAFLPAIQAVEGPINRLGNLVSDHQKQIRRSVRQTVQFVRKGFGQVGGIISGIVKAFSSGNGASSQFAKTWQSLKQFMAPLIPIMKRIGANIMSTLMPGLRDIGKIFTSQVLPAFRKFLPVIQPVAKFLLGVFGDALVGALKGALNVIKGVLKAVSGVFNFFADLFTGKWGKLWGDLKQIMGGLLQGIVGAIQVWWNVGILSLFKKAALFLTKGIWKSLWTGLKTGATKGFGLITKGIDAGVKGIGKLLLKGVKGYLNIWKTLFVGWWRIVSNGWKVLRSAFGGALAAIRTMVSQVFHAITSRIGGAMKAAWGLVKAGATRILTGWRNIGSGIRKALTAIWSGIKSVFGKIVGFFGKVGGKIAEKTKGMFNGIKDAFKGAINWVIDKWNNLSLSVSLPKKIAGISIPGGGGSFGLSTPNIPHLRRGGDVQAGKPYVVGDRGPRHAWEYFVPETDGHVYPKAPTDFDLANADVSVGPAGLGGPTTIVVQVDRKTILEAVLDGADAKVARR